MHCVCMPEDCRRLLAVHFNGICIIISSLVSCTTIAVCSALRPVSVHQTCCHNVSPLAVRRLNPCSLSVLCLWIVCSDIPVQYASALYLRWDCKYTRTPSKIETHLAVCLHGFLKYAEPRDHYFRYSVPTYCLLNACQASSICCHQ